MSDAPRGRSERAFRALGAFVVRWRIALLTLDVLLTLALSGVIASRLEVHNSNDSFLPSSGPVHEAMEALRASFGDDQTFLLLVEGEVFDLDYLARLRALHEDVARIDLGEAADAAPAGTSGGGDGFDDVGWGDVAGGSVVEEVTSLVNVREIAWTEGALHVGGLLDAWPSPAELPALRVRVLGSDVPAAQLVAGSGEMSMMAVRTVPLSHDEVTEVFLALQEVIARHQAPGFQVGIGGASALYAELDGFTMRDMLRLGSAVVFALIAVMLLLFRSPARVFGPLTAVAHAGVWTLGLMAVLGIPLTLVTLILWPMLLCVGVGAAIHVQEVFLDARAEGLDRDEAVRRALGLAGVPVALTAATTAAGLLSFTLADIPPVRELGLLGAFGVGATFVQTVTWVPAFLALDRARPDARTSRGLAIGEVFVGWCNAASRGVVGRRRTLWATAAVVLLGLLFASQVEVAHDTLSFLPRTHAVRATFDRIDTEIGGTNTVSILVEADDVRRQEVFQALQQVEDTLKDFRDPSGARVVTSTDGIGAMVREGWRALHESDPAFYALPDTGRGLKETLLFLETGDPATLGRALTPDGRQALVTARMRWRDSNVYHELLSEIPERFEAAPDVRVRATGSVVNHLAVEHKLSSGFFRSFGGALLVITVFMVLMLRDLRLGLIAMLPNLAPIVMVLGLMGLVGARIDVQNVLISSLVIGVAVDDTIHFLHHFKRLHRQTGDVEAAIAGALHHAGRAIVATTIVLGVGFAAFLASSMPTVRLFGVLVTAAVCFALIADLLFAPALLRLVYRRVEAGVPHSP